MASSAALDGSASYKFVADLPMDFTCPVCLDVVLGAKQTSCCGNHICQACSLKLEELGHSTCPVCNRKSLSLVPDIYFRRKVNELKIYCLYSSEGCSWTGELQYLEKHRTSCDFEPVPCKFTSCKSWLPRASMAEHCTTCCKRPYSCEFCGYAADYDTVTITHTVFCQKFPVPCPNSCGTSESIERCKLQDHLDNTCTRQVIDCEYNSAGCSARMMREEAGKHCDSSIHLHMRLLLEQVKICSQTLANKDAEINALKEDVSHFKQRLLETKASPYHNLGVLVLHNSQRYIDLPWCSPPFLTRPQGYKLGFKVQLHGDVLKMFAYLIGGEHDDQLPWPFTGTLTITLLNQLNHNKHNYDYKFQCRDRTLKRINGRPELDQRGGDIPTLSRYLSLRELEMSHNGECRYLLNNCLQFRVKQIITNTKSSDDTQQGALYSN